MRDRFHPVCCMKSAVLAFLVLSVCSCASPLPTAIRSPFPSDDAERRRHNEELLSRIEERNATVEHDLEWRRHAYEKFLVKNLHEIDEHEYEGYARYLDSGAVYIIVHPAYYTFFQSGDSSSYENRSLLSDSNAVDRLLSEPVYFSTTKLIRAQEKMLRDFLEYMSTDRRLVILILPGGYQEYAGYRYRKASDEYMRFINEVTNESASVLYVYSKKPNRGTLADHEKKALMKLLIAVKAKEILVGGGYMGRCLEDFYKEMVQYYGERLYVVPEITAISPVDVSYGDASDVLLPDGTIDTVKFSQRLRTQLTGSREVRPNMKNLSDLDLFLRSAP